MQEKIGLFRGIIMQSTQVNIHFQTLVEQYHQRRFKLWLIISSIMLAITLAGIAYFQIKQLIVLSRVKNEYLMLAHEETQLKKEWTTHQKLSKKHKDLKKQYDMLCRPAAISEYFVKISQAIPANTYLISIEYNESSRLILKGIASNSEELAMFVQKLKSNGFKEVSGEESQSNTNEACFIITAIF